MKALRLSWIGNLITANLSRFLLLMKKYSGFWSIAFGKLPSQVFFHHLQIGLVQFSCSVVSDSLRPREPQHARPPCPSPTPGVHPDSRPSSQ